MKSTHTVWVSLRCHHKACCWWDWNGYECMNLSDTLANKSVQNKDQQKRGRTSRNATPVSDGIFCAHIWIYWAQRYRNIKKKKKLFLGWRFILALLGRTWYHKYILSQILTILWTHTFWNSYVQLFRNEAHWKKRSPWRFVLSGTLLTQNNIYMYIRLDITFCMRHLQSNGVDSSVKMTWKIGMCTFRLTRSAWENAHIRT